MPRNCYRTLARANRSIRYFLSPPSHFRRLECLFRKLPYQGVCLVALALVFLKIPPAYAAPLDGLYPDASITLTLPFPKEDQQTVLAFALKKATEKAGGYDMLLTYAPGKGGSYAWRDTSKKPPEGYDLCLITMPGFQLQAIPLDAPYTVESLTPICLMVSLPCALWVREDSPIKTLTGLIDVSRAQEQPTGAPDAKETGGQPLNIAGTGGYTEHHIATLILARGAGIKLQYLPYLGSKTASDATKDTAIACWGYALPPNTMPGMRPLAVASGKRSPSLPDTPTFAELGLNEVIVRQYIGLGMPKSDTEEIPENISTFFIKLIQDKEFSGELERAGYALTSIPYAGMQHVIAQMNTELDTFLRDYTMFPQR